MLTPISSNVVVSPKEPERKGLIEIPSVAAGKDEVQEGIVMAVGPGRVTASGVRVPSEVQTGVRICYRRSYAREIETSGERYHVVREEDIFGIVE